MHKLAVYATNLQSSKRVLPQNPYMLMLAVSMLLGFLMTIAFGMGMV